MRYAESESWLRAAMALSVAVHGADHPETLVCQAQLGNLLYLTGRRAEADELHQAIQRSLRLHDVPMDDWRRADVERLLGQSLTGRGRPDLLLPRLRADLDALVRALPRSPMRARLELAWADVQTRLGNIVDARAALALARRQWRTFADGVDTPDTDLDFDLVEARLKLEEGEPLAALGHLDPGRPALLRQELERNVLRAHALRRSGEAGSAVRAAQSAVDQIERLAEGRRPVPTWADALEALGLAKRALGDDDGGRRHLRQALDLRRGNDADGSLHLARIVHELAQLPGN